MSELKTGDYVENVYFVRKPNNMDDIFGAGMNFNPEETDYRGERVRIDKIIVLEDKLFDAFCNDFFASNVKSLECIGGHDGIEKYTHAVLIRNEQNGMEIYVNTEGYDYARYVGVRNEIIIDEDTESILTICKSSIKDELPEITCTECGETTDTYKEYGSRQICEDCYL